MTSFYCIVRKTDSAESYTTQSIDIDTPELLKLYFKYNLVNPKIVYLAVTDESGSKHSNISGGASALNQEPTQLLSDIVLVHDNDKIQINVIKEAEWYDKSGALNVCGTNYYGLWYIESHILWSQQLTHVIHMLRYATQQTQQGSGRNNSLFHSDTCCERADGLAGYGWFCEYASVLVSGSQSIIMRAACQSMHQTASVCV